MIEAAHSSPSQTTLIHLLHSTFGFQDFRPHQEAVCRAVTGGENVLLVMPTGAGKSLCYQLPGLARNGTTLVVSPLIALMEDQVAQLKQKGLRAERIHSGRDRQSSREVCTLFIKGQLDFLFIAPERLGVPRFPELLAKGPIALIAIDEAHCISQWGHDFRPDYRRLKERLLPLSRAPIIALTATATPRVQDDIVQQLGIPKAHRFILGFRRTNIGIEVIEVSPSLRTEAVKKILETKDRFPTIIYAPTRKAAEALAEELQDQASCAAYHAGMLSSLRDAVQEAFLAGALDVIVATIAFGMGIDKPDIRTVIHTGLPSSIESYYQEIGRAGRDGLPSRAILMHSYADCRLHEFFLQRDYPEPEVLQEIYKALMMKAQPKEALREKFAFDEDLFDKAIEKLWIHGGAKIDPAENILRGDRHWKNTYIEQRQHKLEQLTKVAQFADWPTCRMLNLVRHFGDQADSGELCGQCDICAPGASLAQQHRTPTEKEVTFFQRILQSLRQCDRQATGRLYREEFETDLTRREFEVLVSTLVRAGLAALEEDQFEKDGKEISFRRVRLTADGGSDTTAEQLAERIKLPIQSASAKRTKKASSRRRKGSKESPAGAPKKSANQTASNARKAASPFETAALSQNKKPGRIGQKSGKRKTEANPNLSGDGRPIEVPAALIRDLKEWRLQEARRREIPAFRIFSDRVLLGIASSQPQDEKTLLAVPGVGSKLLEKYGPKILSIIKEAI